MRPRTAIFLATALLFGCQSDPPATRPMPTSTTEPKSLSAAAMLARADASASHVDSILSAIDDAEKIVENDLRNLDTPGYKASVARVSADGRLSVGIDPGEGEMRSTNRSLDLAIQGS